MASLEVEEAAAGVTADYSGEIQRLRHQECRRLIEAVNSGFHVVLVAHRGDSFYDHEGVLH